MRLAFFDYNLNFGGAPRGSIDLFGNLMDAGLEVVIFDVYGANEKYHNYIDKKNLPSLVIYPSNKAGFIGGAGLSRLLNLIRKLPEFINIVRRARVNIINENVGIVFVNNLKSLVTVSFACAGLNVKKVFYHRGWAQPESFGVGYKFFVNTFCHVLLGHSQATVENLKAVFPGKKAYYVNNFVDTPVRRDFNFGGSLFKVLLPAARPVYEKGHHTALEALFVLKQRGHEVRLVLPGEVAKGVSDEYVETLYDYIRSRRLQNDVEFVGWVDSLDEQICAADVVILPSHTEGFPRVVIESMLLNTPVIATPVGGVPEAIVDGETGLLVGINDAVGLADAIERLMLDPASARLIANNAQDYAVRNFSKERQCELIVKVLAEA